MEEAPAKNKRSWWQWLSMAAVAIVLLYFSFRGVKWGDFVRGLSGCDFKWVGASMAVSILAFYIRALRWRLILLPLNPSVTRRECYDGVTTAYMTNFVIPRAGEFARCGVIAGTGKIPFESALGSVVLERSIDLMCDFIILIAVVWFSWDRAGDFMTDVIWGSAEGKMHNPMLWTALILLSGALIICVMMYRFRDALSRKPFFAKLFGIMKRIWDGLSAGFRSEHKWGFLLYTVALWVCYWLMSLFTIYALGQLNEGVISIAGGDMGMNGADALFLMIVGSLGWIVPVQGGIGAYHFILSLALSSIYAIPQTDGIVFATISHESQAFTMLLCGAMTLITAYGSKRYFRRKNS